VYDVVEQTSTRRRSRIPCVVVEKITTRRREGVGVASKQWRKSTNFQNEFTWFTYTKNARRNSGCPLHISDKKWKCKWRITAAIMKAKRSMSRWC